MTLWEEYSEAEQAIWLYTNVLHKPVPIGELAVINYELVSACEAALSPAHQRTYVRYLSSDIATKTYAGLTDAEQVSEETSDKFYFNFLRVPLNLRAERIWNVVASFAP